MDLIQTLYIPQEIPNYDPADGCVAIVAVAEDGDYIFIEKPNIWVFDAEPDPKDNGFGDSFDLPPGVYKMTFKYNEYIDRESGMVDDWDFDIEKCEPLWEYKNE